MCVDACQLPGAGGGLEVEIDETGARDFGAFDQIVGRQCRGDRLRQLARIAARGLREAQGDIGREITVLRITCALDGDLGGLGNCR